MPTLRICGVGIFYITKEISTKKKNRKVPLYISTKKKEAPDWYFLYGFMKLMD